MAAPSHEGRLSGQLWHLGRSCLSPIAAPCCRRPTSVLRGPCSLSRSGCKPHPFPTSTLVLEKRKAAPRGGARAPQHTRLTGWVVSSTRDLRPPGTCVHSMPNPSPACSITTIIITLTNRLSKPPRFRFLAPLYCDFRWDGWFLCVPYVQLKIRFPMPMNAPQMA